MKTSQQIKFEHLISRIIQSNAYIMERRGLLDDFREDSNICYEVFCDRIYTFFEDRSQGVLSVDERGRTHINSTKNTAYHVYFELLTEKDYIEDSEDVIDYINLALARLEEQVATIYRTIN